MPPGSCVIFPLASRPGRPTVSPAPSGRSVPDSSRRSAGGCSRRTCMPSGSLRAFSCSTPRWHGATQALQTVWFRICCFSVLRPSLRTVRRFPVCVLCAQRSDWSATSRWTMKPGALAALIRQCWFRPASGSRQLRKPGRLWPGEIATSSSLQRISSVWCAIPCASFTATARAWRRP